MPDHQEVIDRLGRIFLEGLDIEVSSPDVDLFEAGLLDSLAVAELLVQVEDEFEVTLPVAELDLDDLRTLRRIGEFLVLRCGLAVQS